MRVTVLGSGSRGNAILVDGTEGSVMVDAGFGRRALEHRLISVGRSPGEIGALLLTHEHTDHACGAQAASARWGWPVFAVQQTHDALTLSAGGAPVSTGLLSFQRSTSVVGFDVGCVLVPHDARACAALVLTDQVSGARIGIALDLGHVPTRLPGAFERCDLLVVESNHDEQMLANGPYPASLKRRIAGRLGHLSNGTAASLIAQLGHRDLRGVILAHLSETNNTPSSALTRSRDALRRAGWSADGLCAATQTCPSEPFRIDEVSRQDRRPAQLSLSL